jgi:peptide-methionine (S)-S-oxide reductase
MNSTLLTFQLTKLVTNLRRVVALPLLSLAAFNCQNATQTVMGTPTSQSMNNASQTPAEDLPITTVSLPSPTMAVATFGNGCFWCTEAVFQDLKGVSKVVSGYSGGQVKNPTYRQVGDGNTGHAEALQIFYDPAIITFDALLEIFWSTHDPTTLNRQGADVGSQYRSAIFYHSPEQKELAQAYLAKLDASGAFDKKIVTEITPFANFYPAEDYHQNYFKLNGEQPYCQFVIRPKMDKMRKVFGDKLVTK